MSLPKKSTLRRSASKLVLTAFYRWAAQDEVWMGEAVYDEWMVSGMGDSPIGQAYVALERAAQRFCHDWTIRPRKGLGALEDFMRKDLSSLTKDMTEVVLIAIEFIEGEVQ